MAANIHAKSSIYEDVIGFYHAVSWSEDRYAFIALCSLHAAVLVSCLAARRLHPVYGRMFSFSLPLALCAISEPLNSFLSTKTNWFSQQYFDKNGLFLAISYSAPLLLFALVCLVELVLHVSYMLIKVKRKEFKID